MADTASAIIERVRWLINDVDAAPITDSIRMLRLVADGVNHIAGRVRLPAQRSTSAVTLVAGTRDYTLTAGGTQYDRVLEVVRQSDKFPLQKVSLETMSSMQFTSSSGAPQAWCPLEDTDQDYIIRVWPTPNASGALDIVRTIFPPVIADGTETIPFSENLLSALEKHVAANILIGANEEDLKKMRLTKQIADVWLREVETDVRRERVRLNRLRRTGRIERVEA